MSNIAALTKKLMRKYNYPSQVKELEAYNSSIWKGVLPGGGEVGWKHGEELIHQTHKLKSKYLRSAVYGFGVSAAAIGLFMTDILPDNGNISETIGYASELFVFAAGLIHGMRSMYLAKKVKDGEYEIRRLIIKDYKLYDLSRRMN